MIESMTGYGKEVIHLPSKTISVEIKSLNSKGLDINVRIPSAYREKELEIRDKIAKTLKRGKIDFTVSVDIAGEIVRNQINKAVVNQYIRQLADIVNGDPLELLKMAVRMPDSMSAQAETLDEAEYAKLLSALNTALKRIQEFRIYEGEILEKDFKQRIKNIQSLLTKIEKTDGNRIEAIRNRLHKAVSELKEEVDENRFEQELIFYIEKFDITEEKVRLNSHLNYFLEVLKSKESNGKKLGFILQEIGREINTIGSKANDASIQQLVVQMKDELEKMKEQTMNIL
ncbi:MAG: YicC family protein [Bacteroidetes bacterium]|nr:YicC family protein [Bacteroidota bacterium]